MEPVEMINVSSSNIEAIGFDPALDELYVRFLKGGTYIYSNVSQYQFDEFVNAGSKGQWLDQNVKKPGNPYRKF